MKVKQVTPSKGTTGAIEKNIYAEVRSGSVRFVVQVSPTPKDSHTCDIDKFDEGLR